MMSPDPAVKAVLNDVTERRVAEARRSALSHEIARTSELEQRRIGQDLHDDICQRLAALKMNLQDFEEALAEQAPVLMDQADAMVNRLSEGHPGHPRLGPRSLSCGHRSRRPSGGPSRDWCGMFSKSQAFSADST